MRTFLRRAGGKGINDDATGFHTQLRALRYVGSKIRLMTKLRPIFHSMGATFFVDVFGGSGAVIMGAGFNKRVSNDVDSDVVEFLRVLADRVRIEGEGFTSYSGIRARLRPACSSCCLHTRRLPPEFQNVGNS